MYEVSFLDKNGNLVSSFTQMALFSADPPPKLLLEPAFSGLAHALSEGTISKTEVASIEAAVLKDDIKTLHNCDVKDTVRKVLVAFTPPINAAS